MSTTQGDGQDLNIRTLENEGIIWINIERPTASELGWLETNYGIHPMALLESPTHGEMSTLDNFDSYLAITMFVPLFDEQSHLTQSTEVDIFVGKNYLVMMHNGNLDSLNSLFQDCQSNTAKLSEMVQGSSGFLLYNILNMLTSYCLAIVGRLESSVDEVELRVFDERARDLVKEISLVRRDIISFLRVMRHLSGVFQNLEAKSYDFLNIESEVYFGEVANNIRSIRAELDELKEVIEGLGDAHSTLINHQTNSIIRILTIMSAILLPLSVVSGLYGMNVGLPLADTPYAFGIVIGLMVVIAGAMLIFFRMRHWI